MGVPLSNARCIFCLSPVYTDFTFCDSFTTVYRKKKRLQLIYGDRALYAFFNRDMGERMGSVSEILIPIDLAMLHAAEDEPDGEEAFNG